MRYIFTIIGLLATMFAYGQSENTSTLADSLLQQIDQADEVKKVAIYNKLSSLYHTTNPKKSVEYAQKAINLSQNNNFRIGVARGLNNIGQAQAIRGNYVNALAYYLRALTMIEAERPEMVASDKANMLGNIAEVYYRISSKKG